MQRQTRPAANLEGGRARKMLPPPASMHARPRVACRPPPSLTSRCGLRPGQITVLEASVIVIPEHHKATQDKPCGNMVGSKMTVTDTLRRQQHGPWWCVLKHRPRLDGATNDNDAAENQTFHHEGALKKEIPPKWGGGGGKKQRNIEKREEKKKKKRGGGGGGGGRQGKGTLQVGTG